MDCLVRSFGIADYNDVLDVWQETNVREIHRVDYSIFLIRDI